DDAALPGDAADARRPVVLLRPQAEPQAARHLPALSPRAGAVEAPLQAGGLVRARDARHLIRARKAGRRSSIMIGRLNHVAIAVRDIAKAAEVYKPTLGADVSAAVPLPDHGVTTVFITLPNTKIELLEPFGDNSPIAKFLERNPDGGIHHVC